MSGTRRWAAAGLLLVVAGVLTAISTARHWAICRADPASLRCLALQDATHGFPGWGGLGRPDLGTAAAGIVAALLLSVAWVGVIGWARGSGTRNLLCVVVGVQPLIAATVLVIEATGFVLPAAVGGWLTWPAEAYVFPFLLGAGWLVNESLLGTLRLLTLGWGVTSFGSIHHVADSVVARLLSPDAVGASPPGLGYATAATQVLVGLVVVVLTLQRAVPDTPDTDDGPERDGFTLAA
ncbi:MAG: hypothetical protein ACR2LI_00880 [Propionibacteriaceae bacterium]